MVRLRNLFRRLTNQDLVMDHVRWWAQQYDMDVVALERSGIPTDLVKDGAVESRDPPPGPAAR
jgi:hypothetical protein